MDRLDAIEMLENVRRSLNRIQWKEKSLCLIRNYKIQLIRKINPQIDALVEKYNVYVRMYGLDNDKTIKLSEKINNKIAKFISTC